MWLCVFESKFIECEEGRDMQIEVNIKDEESIVQVFNGFIDGEFQFFMRLIYFLGFQELFKYFFIFLFLDRLKWIFDI